MYELDLIDAKLLTLLRGGFKKFAEKSRHILIL